MAAISNKKITSSNRISDTQHELAISEINRERSFYVHFYLINAQIKLNRTEPCANLKAINP